MVNHNIPSDLFPSVVLKVVILVDATVAMASENDMSVMRKKALAKYWSYTNNLMFMNISKTYEIFVFYSP